MTNLNELRGVAERAVKGKWYACQLKMLCGETFVFAPGHEHAPILRGFSDSTGDFVITFQPATVLKLLAICQLADAVERSVCRADMSTQDRWDLEKLRLALAELGGVQ